MFEWNDVLTFFWAFFLVLPLAAIVHQMGHTFFALLFGGKGCFTVGRGKTIVKLGVVKIKHLYFLDSFCEYENLKYDSRYAHALVYLGGPLFNLLSVLGINSLINAGFLEANQFLYQFSYFSVYFVFFALFPVKYSEHHSTDGRAIYDVLKYGKTCATFD
ncbi:hypothetical protein LRR81_13550 [Metabacillus sp. GX 13764]|uniref:hypothetical protein n=1 Tax=Metabacillus kandeliae TaxID=2900151 RepID=UPI001E4BD599|nr:hypothetical protein [Metabacillus kandeliae]